VSIAEMHIDIDDKLQLLKRTKEHLDITSKVDLLNEWVKKHGSEKLDCILEPNARIYVENIWSQPESGLWLFVMVNAMTGERVLGSCNSRNALPKAISRALKKMLGPKRKRRKKKK